MAATTPLPAATAPLLAAVEALAGLVAWTDQHPALLGGRCERCHTHTFPAVLSCPRCGATAIEAVALPTEGTVWSVTVQRLEPKAPFRGPSPFEPFAVAYVDLGTVRIEGRLGGRPVGEWAIGDPVVVAVEPLPGEDPADPQARWTYLFRPLERGA